MTLANVFPRATKREDLKRQYEAIERFADRVRAFEEAVALLEVAARDVPAWAVSQPVAAIHPVPRLLRQQVDVLRRDLEKRVADTEHTEPADYCEFCGAETRK